MAHRRFDDRADAGRQLAEAVAGYGIDEPVVLALPRGGVVVGAAVAARLGAGLDVVVCRKLGVPGRRELAMGALAEGGVRVLNEEVLAALRIRDEEIEATTAQAEVEVARQVEQYRGGRPRFDVAGRNVVVVDDGLATGMTAEAALRDVARYDPARLFLAIPVCGPESADRLRPLVESVICVLVPEDFMAVGAWYRYFAQTTDQQVLDHLADARRAGAGGAPRCEQQYSEPVHDTGGSMSTDRRVPIGRIESLWRYPVKSMLGEMVPAADVDDRGLAGDRALAVVDRETGVVATAKNPRRWRALLQARAEAAEDGTVLVHLPGHSPVASTDAAVDELISGFLGRPVTLASKAEAGGQLERAVPEEVLERGADAEVGVTTVEFAAASPPGTFFDFTPLQMVTTASLRRVGELHPDGRVEAVRYRPNVVIDTGDGVTGFIENGWVERLVHLGSEVVVRVLVPSPRCAVPTLAHGDLPPDPDALRIPLRHNHVEVPIPGFGAAPCVGVHVAVVHPGRIAVGDEVSLGVPSGP